MLRVLQRRESVQFVHCKRYDSQSKKFYLRSGNSLTSPRTPRWNCTKHARVVFSGYFLR